MKKRLTGKKAGIVILAALFIISIVDVILRSVIMKESMLNIANAGEPIIAALFSLMLIIFAVKGKDRLFYICTGAFLAYFVLSQLFSLPGMIATFISVQSSGWASVSGNAAILIQIFSMICIVAIGGLLVEYMNDGSIYNRAFNILCIVTILMALCHTIIGISDIISGAPSDIVFSILNNLSRMTMVFLFTFFAYDSAKAQLAKTKL